MKKYAVPLLLAAALAAVGVTVVRLFVALPNYGFIMHSHTSGTWATLAYDLAHGVFYRPIISDSGGFYGGTRYFPLHFVLHAGLIRLLGGTMVAGHLLGIVSVAALIAGVYRTLRALEVEPRISAACGALVLAGAGTQLALTRVGSDSLAAALAMWGLSFCVAAAPMTARRVVAAGVLFALAFFTKQTCLSALAAAVLALGLSGQRGAALKVAGLTALLLVAGVLGLDALTHHRFLEAGTLGAGEVSSHSLLEGPKRLVLFLLFSDPAGLLFLLLSLGVTAARAKLVWREPPTLLLLITLANLAILFGQPGTEPNHLLELDAAVVLFLGTQLGRGRLSLGFGAPAMTGATALALVLIGVFMIARPPWQDVPTDNRKDLAALLEKAGPADRGPLLAENPWVALLNDERPQVLDAIAARLIPGVHAQLLERVRTRAFRAVVLQQDPAKEREWYEDTHLGKGFTDQLLASYAPAGQFGLNYLFLPRDADGVAPTTEAAPR